MKTSDDIPSNLDQAYQHYRRKCRQEGCEWKFTRERWVAFWQGYSGRIGEKSGDYAISLTHPNAAYCETDCMIIKIAKVPRDNRFTGQGKGRTVIDPDGRVFHTIADAALAYERHRETIANWCRKNRNGWRFAE